MLTDLQAFHAALQSLHKAIRNERGTQIAKKALRTNTEKLATTWLNQFAPLLADQQGINLDKLAEYTTAFQRLLKLSAPNNQRKSYLDTLRPVVKGFRDDFTLPVQSAPSTQPSATLLGKIFATLPDPKEDEYLQEAIECARHKYYRASTILGWCAAIDRVHRKLDELGLDKFNVKSAQMASKKQGRFKRFSSPQNLSSMSELRMVFDTTILWVLEGMGLIDSNQHTRLRSCFELRCHCAHPGDAPLTEYNLMSFFSDINEIVLQGAKFQVARPVDETE